MSQLSNSNSTPESGSWSNVLDDLPLLQRRNLLLLKPHSGPGPRRLCLSSDAVGKQSTEDSVPLIHPLALKHEDDHSGLQDSFCTKKYAPEPTNDGKISRLLDSGGVKVEPSHENDFLSHQMPPPLSGLDAVLTEQNGKFHDEDEWSDELDHIALIHRRELLLSKQLLPRNGSYSCNLQVYARPSVIYDEVSIKEEERRRDSLQNNPPYPAQGIGIGSVDHVARRENELIQPICENSKAGNEPHGDCERRGSDFCGSLVTGIANDTFVGPPCEETQCSLLPGYMEVKVAESAKLSFNVKARTSEGTSLLKRKSSKRERCSRTDDMPFNEKRSPNSASGTAVSVKIEPSDYGEVLDSRREPAGNFAFNSSSVKREEEGSDHLFEDKLDHMLLRERMNLLISRSGSLSDHLKNCDWLTRAPSASKKIPAVVESVKPISIKRPQKRRKTVTDSVETALEEDAPGLLRVLLDQGVSVDEIKLYGDMEDDDAQDDSSGYDGFAELEDVIAKLFSQRQTLLKFGKLRKGRDTKTTYCLACLFSLVEQTRYLQFRKWPVEWGWCRDLRSFIFVFERHKRIVLERPEYGYATYFFELVNSLPIAWQLRRLEIAMKLTSCSRISLIENKALTVGEDLSEGEARVLMEYGWRPNSGLGTMLNYCDRVVHDRRNEIEKDTSEWRAKIGKLLMDGYNGGAIISSSILEKAIETENPERSEVKREFLLNE